jgi:hypothetical protein
MGMTQEDGTLGVGRTSYGTLERRFPGQPVDPNALFADDVRGRR